MDKEKIRVFNFKKRKMRAASVGTTLAMFGVISLLADSPRITAEIPLTSLEEQEISETTTEEIIDAELEDNESLGYDVAEKLIKKYNDLGNKLEKKDLGCVVQSLDEVSYLFKDENNDFVFDITQDTDGLNRVLEDYTLYIFVDKENTSKPICGICEIKEQDYTHYESVNVKSVFVPEIGRTIKDENNYITMTGSKENFEATEEYFNERKQMVAR